MIIEVSGVPGSGKTTNRLKILKRLSRQYGKVIDSDTYINRLVNNKFNKLIGKIKNQVYREKAKWIIRNLMLLIYFICSMPYYFRLHIFYVKCIFTNKQGYKALKSYYFKFGKNYIVKKNLKTEHIVFTEGIVHTTQSLFVKSTLHEPDNSEIKHYLNSIPLPDVLFIVYNRNNNELIDRLKFRGHHRVTKDSLSIENFINNSIKIEDTVLNIISKTKNTHIIKAHFGFKSLDVVMEDFNFSNT